MKKSIALFACIVLFGSLSHGQDKLYSNAFPLSDVRLLDGPFKRAEELNTKVLLEYDTDRLLAPFLHEAGLPPKADYFPNWAGLDGHMGGHYLSALAIHYAATGNAECKQRMDYILSELKRCQQANGDGYIGGVPDGKKIWTEIRSGRPEIVWNYWVPWYNVHKTFAGLRDAWLYTGNEEAREMFLKLCDWGYAVTQPLTDEQMKGMVAQEYGGMNEVYADAYQMTGNERYLWMAKRFGSDFLFDDVSRSEDKLDNLHANTQVPKAVGYQRTAEVSGDEAHRAAGLFFWETVVNHRSLSFGGNSRREHFPSAEDCVSYTEEREGPESCNTYNMLKLSEGLFRMSPEARYADYYERALFNHILSTQHPEHGGYVYFTPARPAHYRVYSAPNQGMWCCVGTGMENHGKYGEFIYTHAHDSLYVNLFIASELNWREKGVQVTQTTRFPDEESSELRINTAKPSRFTVLVRVPEWAKPGETEIVCNGRNYAEGALPSSYVAIDRKWKNGDVIRVKTPMEFAIEEMPNVPEFISILYGPIVMGIQTGTEHLDGLVADDHRWAHIAHGPLVSLFDTAPIIGTREEIQSKLAGSRPATGGGLRFTVPGLFQHPDYQHAVLEPFSGIHDSRYQIYWLSATAPEYDRIQAMRREEERQKLILDDRTVDAVNTGEQQPEADHLMKQANTRTGTHREERWRQALPGGYFQYEMKTGERENLSLLLRYWGGQEAATFDILIDGQLLSVEPAAGQPNREGFVNVEYRIPAEMLASKESILVKFVGKAESPAGRIFHVRLVEGVR